MGKTVSEFIPMQNCLRFASVNPVQRETIQLQVCGVDPKKSWPILHWPSSPKHVTDTHKWKTTGRSASFLYLVTSYTKSDSGERKGKDRLRYTTRLSVQILWRLSLVRSDSLNWKSGEGSSQSSFLGSEFRHQGTVYCPRILALSIMFNNLQHAKERRKLWKLVSATG